AVLCYLCILLAPAAAQQRARIRVDDYVIDAELTPRTHHLAAHTRVKFTALDDVNSVTFDLHNALHVTKVEDAAGKALTAERSTQNSTVTVALPTLLPKD